MKVIITAGGGGHFAPALSVIEHASQKWDILLVGRKYAFEGDSALSFEFQIAQERHIAFKAITTARWQRKFTRYTIPSFFKFPIGLIQSLQILRQYRPDIILSFGGYVSLPVVVISFLFGIPVVIHEQTLEAGMANKIASLFAKKVCISWESSKAFFPKSKTILTGNPMRKEIIRADAISQASLPKMQSGLPVIYITGGSLGSHPINVLVEGCIEKLLENYQVIHQVGSATEYHDFERLEKKKAAMSEEKKKRYIVQKFFDSASSAFIMQHATLVIGRCGINTLTELLYLQKPSLLIPLPVSQQNEQLKNALFVKKQGLGEVYSQDDLSSEALYVAVQSIIKNIAQYKLSQDTKKTLCKDAAERIIQIVQKEVANV